MSSTLLISITNNMANKKIKTVKKPIKTKTVDPTPPPPPKPK